MIDIGRNSRKTERSRPRANRAATNRGEALASSVFRAFIRPAYAVKQQITRRYANPIRRFGNAARRGKCCLLSILLFLMHL